MAATSISQCVAHLDRQELPIGARGTVGGDLVEFSIFNGVPIDLKNSLLDDVQSEKPAEALLVDRCIGAMLGMVIGDAVGAPLEFMPVVNVPATGPACFDLKEMKYIGRPKNMFDVKPGQWTDDSSMGLCLADSLICKEEFDGSDVNMRFWNWHHQGYNNSFRYDVERAGDEETRKFMLEAGLSVTASLQSIGCGKQMRTSLVEYPEGGRPPSACKPKDESQDDGNAGLIRLAPVPIFCACKPIEECMDMARASSYTTHSGFAAAEAAAFLAFVMHRALNRNETFEAAGDQIRQPIQIFLDSVVDEYVALLVPRASIPSVAIVLKLLRDVHGPESTELCWNWREPKIAITETLTNRSPEYNGCKISPDYFGSYALDGLAVALWAVYHTTSVSAAIVQSANLLGDADSVACIAGQLSGAFYGCADIEEGLIAQLRRWDPQRDVELRAILLLRLGERSVHCSHPPNAD